MIPESVALARLAHERMLLRRRQMPITPYMLGMIHGLTLASAILNTLWVETKEQFKRNPNYLAACFSNCKPKGKR